MISLILKRFGAFFFLFILSFQPIVAYASSSDAAETVAGLSAYSHCLMDADTGAVLSASNVDLSLPMASTTKIMTCILALEEKDLNEKVEIPRAAVGVEGSSVYLTNGEVLTMEELLYALMLESANDAAVAIALAIDPEIELFAERMNEKARLLGMNSTCFKNPHGLPCDGHHSTARDLCILMAYCMENPAFAEITATKTKSISAPDGKTRFLSNHNRLLRNLETCIGGKTGYTKTAGRCLVTAAEERGKTLVCATLGDPNDWKDHAALFSYGFSMYEEKTLTEAGDIIVELPAVGGVQSTVLAINLSSAAVLLRTEEKVEMHLELPSFVYAPVEKEAYLGEAVFTLNGNELARIELTAKEAVEQEPVKIGFFQKLWNLIKTWWQKLWNK